MQLPFEKSHAFLIGINEYQHVSRLHTAVNDARVVAEKLKKDHHYIIHGPLLNPTKADLVEYIDHTIKKVVGKEDRVLFYFAGHGIALDSEEGPNGYLVPVDAKAGEVTTLLAMTELHDALTGLPCRHGLLILDCCFSGAFKWSSGFRDIVFDLPGIVYEQRFYQYLKDPAWQVITSSASDQKAVDVLENHSLGLRENVDKHLQHSPFAMALLAGISGDADVVPKGKGDGVITTTELYTYLRDWVEDATMAQSKRQTPALFSLKRHDKGQYVFMHPRHPFNLPPAPDRNPFMGLKSYNEEDASLFYGRDRVIEALKELIHQQNFIVVSGASGTGKSSVIKAGLLPNLRKEGWEILPVIRPGKMPMDGLQEQIPTLEAVLSPNNNTVLIIDQYEELITQCLEVSQKEAFEQQLVDWLTQYPTLRIIISVRSDFEPQFEENVLSPWWNKGRYTIPTFSTEELREVIIKPTIQEVLFFEPDSLVEDLVDAVNQAPGALPLLSFTLSELYHSYLNGGRTNRALTQADYEKLGGVIGALRTRADKVYNDLDDAHQNSMRQLMLRMVSIEGGELAGKRVLTEDLQFVNPEETIRVKAVTNQLVEARLVQQGKDTQGKIFIEPAHDALVRAWRRLWEWVKTIGEDKLSWQSKLTIAVRDYEALQQENPSKAQQLLWNNNPRLDLLKAELDAKNHGFNIRETEFVQQSVQLRTKKRRQFISSLIGVIVFLIGASIFSFIQYQNTQDALTASQRIARSNNNALKALEKDQTDPTLALRMAEANYSLYPESRSAVGIFSRLMDEESKAKAKSTIRKNLSDGLTMTFSSDAKRILAGYGNGAKLWDLAGNELQDFEGHQIFVLSTAFSPDGKTVLTGSLQTGAKLWDLEGKELSSFEDVRGDPTTVNAVAYSPDSKYILTGLEDGLARLYNLAGEELQLFKGHDSAIKAVAFSPDGQTILTGSEDSTVKLWDLKGSELQSLEEHDGEITVVAFSPDGQNILTGSADYTAKSWDLTGKLVQNFRGHDLSVDALAFSPDGQTILTGSADKTAKLWDLKRGNILRNFIGHEGGVESVAFLPSGKEVLTGSKDMLKLWDLESAILQDFQRPKTATTVFAFSPDRQLVATGSRNIENSTADTIVKLWDLEGELMQKFLGHTKSIEAISFAPDGQTILTGSADKMAKLWDLKGTELQNFVGHSAKVITAVYAPDGKKILTGSIDSTAILWDLQGNELQNFIGHNGGIVEAIYSPDGKKILTGSWDRTAILWDLQGNILQQFEGHTDGVVAVDFSPDGKKILTGSNDKTAKLWDLEGNELQSFQGNIFSVSPVIFSPDGQYILTGNFKTVQVWDLQGNLLRNFRHQTSINSIVFSPEGNILVSATNNVVKLWLNPITFFNKKVEAYSKDQLKEKGLEFTEIDWENKKEW